MAKQFDAILALKFYDRQTRLIYPVEGAFFSKSGHNGDREITDVMIAIGLRDVRYEGILLGWTKVLDKNGIAIYDRDILKDPEGQIWFAQWRDDWAGFRAVSPDGKLKAPLSKKMEVVGNKLITKEAK